MACVVLYCLVLIWSPLFVTYNVWFSISLSRFIETFIAPNEAMIFPSYARNVNSDLLIGIFPKYFL